MEYVKETTTRQNRGNSARSQMDLQHGEKIPHPEEAFNWPLNKNVNQFNENEIPALYRHHKEQKSKYQKYQNMYLKKIRGQSN